MKIEEAYKITNNMTEYDHSNPSSLQREAKETIYSEVVHPKYKNKDGSINPLYEPDWNEGWK